MILNVLVIVKDKTDLSFLETMLKEIKCSIKINILTASDYEETIVIANTTDINLLILDTAIDGSTNFDISIKLKNNNLTKNISTIFLTNNFNYDEFVENGYSLENIDYCTKPIEKYQFLNKIYLYLKLYVNKQELKEYKKAINKASIVSRSDLQGQITYVNDKFCKISGYCEKELIGKPHSIVRSPNEPKKLYEDLWKTIQSKQSWEGIIENRAKNGSSYFVKAFITPILNHKDEIVEYLSIREDITELKKKELAELDENIDKALKINWEKTVESMPVPTVVVNSDSIIQSSNELYKEIFTSNDDEYLGGCFIDNDEYIHSDEILDWKDMAINYDSQAKVLVNVSGNETAFYLDIKKLDNNLYTVCFHSIEEA